MDISEIIGLILACFGLVALIVLLYLVMIPIANVEKDERKSRKIMYKTITKYLNYLMSDDSNCEDK